ncbi:MAG: serine/threonine protein kinase [Myxococcales bacterium]|nr:serine/threonine protein kinase [Myxococcales bacterium]
MTQTPTMPTGGTEGARAAVERAIARTRASFDGEGLAPDATVRGSVAAPPPAQRATLAPMPTERLPRLSLDRGASLGAVTPTTSDAEWVVRSLLGRGGMGQVFSGEQRSLGRTVAVKVATSADGGEALLREARITGRLEHPNIVPVHVLGVESEGAPVMVMKRIEGVSWRALLRDRDHEQWRRWSTQHRDALEAHVSVLLSVCDALEYAHQKKVIHRDIKPDNVMIGPFGEVYLLDWGIALELDREAPPSDGSLVGTPAYMPPELVDAEVGSAGPWTDIYLLGASLFEALEGRPPHAGSTVFEALAAAYESAPPTFSTETPEFLAALCAAAMRRAPEERTPSVAAFSSALRAWLAHRDSLASSALGESALEDGAAGGAEAISRLIDARLAFERALRLWPENSRAHEGLLRALRAEFAAEIARRNATAARALLDELAQKGASREEDSDALAELDSRLASERVDAERARAAQRELDLSGWRGSRVWLFAAVTLAVAAAAVAIARAPAPDYTALLRADIAVISLLVAAVLAFRRRLAANRIGRRLVSVLLLCALASTSVDVFGLWLRWPLLWGSVHRLVAISVVLAFAALMELRSLLVVAALSAAGALAVLLVPSQHVVLTPLVLLAVNVVTGWLVATGRVRSVDAVE